MFVDSHCHLEMESFAKDRKKIIEDCIKEGLVYMLTVGTEEKYFGKVTEILDRHDQIYGAVGIHPHNSKDYSDKLAQKIDGYLEHNKIVAYGEIGLDFFKNYSPKEAQISVFRKQIETAKKHGLPIIVHSRSAKDETLQILKDSEAWSTGGVIHCYSYDLETSKTLLDMGFYISIPGTVTYSNSQKLAEVVRYVPADMILSETDAPFLTPHPLRGKRNEPHFVKYVVEKIADIKGMSIEDTAAHIKENFERLFLKGNNRRK